MFLQQDIYDKCINALLVIADEVPPRSLVFVGAPLRVCTDICVISNALLIKAFSPETHVEVDSFCCVGVSPESHERALEAMKFCQIEVI